jgi:anti-sigma-K factor RskA
MSTMRHIDDQVAASALGALSPDEQQQVDEHRAICPPCDHLLTEAEESANMLAFLAPATPPPSRCKMRLMERIEDDLFLRRPTPRQARSRVPMWSGWAVAAAVFVGMMMWNMQLQSRLTTASMVGSVLASQPVSRDLVPQDQAHKGVVARMYMSPSSNYALLVLDNVDPAPAGKVYRVWVANETEKSQLMDFHTVADDQPMVLQPSEPLANYKWIMITMEDEAEATSPEETTILLGDL